MSAQLELFKKRMMDLAGIAYKNSCFTFTGFLSTDEISDFKNIENEFKNVGYKLFGGYDKADRMMIRFGSEDDLGYSENFPIAVAHISPMLKKFSDTLTHRDFLGAVLNLGIVREKVGDIIINDNEGYIFATDKLAEYICENISKVKHTAVKGEAIDLSEFAARGINSLCERREMQLTVTSMRCDCIVAAVCKISRNRALELFSSSKIFVNGRLNENNSAIIKENDTITVRGFGKFEIAGEMTRTRSGRLRVIVSIYA